MRRRVHVAVALVTLVVLAACGQAGAGEKENVAAPLPVSVAPTSAEPEPTAEEVTEEATPEPVATTKKATKSTSPSPSPTEEDWSQKPDCAEYVGKNVSKGKAKAALKKASARVYWRTEAPKLKLNFSLVRAVSWQESGWQSAIRNCDGGFGLMQVMPDTLAHINQRFGLDYNANGDPQDNAYAGANYLAWLTKYFGDAYFKGSYDLSPSKCKSHSSWCLLNVVVSAYNAGYGTVDDGAARKALPNPAYVDSVRSLMADCPCDKY
ncbi:transglycosylase SLT domain-containing protein [Actinoplanes sp. NEAU-A12]|uniref:Transglycosylase SLT domain-containing protein n=1 Tax=Actinoplanes sandaracinus TaxID=3045177 RepID=A0ABT6WXU1_9ACTN|nr:transglycosylase SLT domain-containing protein [Actinoplanes sandaracinus]MDI6104562.1 transglycosylase SLT domain-containing protein [Actinoplanes sandaracinus]